MVDLKAMRYLRLTTMIFALLCLSSSLLSQELRWPDRYPSKGKGALYNDAPILKGYILLKNGDTLKGEIKVPPGFEFSFCSILPFGEDASLKNIIDIYPKEINYVRVYSPAPKEGFSDFVSLEKDGKYKIWRLLGKKGTVSVYDDFVQTYFNRVRGNFQFQDPGCKKYYTPRMILISDAKRIKIYGPHLRKSYSLVLKFINKRYGKSFTKNDFRTTNDLINYILENEKQVQ